MEKDKRQPYKFKWFSIQFFRASKSLELTSLCYPRSIKGLKDPRVKSEKTVSSWQWQYWFYFKS